MNLRMLGLAAVVVVAALLPLVASAGPAGKDAEAPRAHDMASDAKAPGGAQPGAARAPRDMSPVRTAERCGPEVTSPEGIEAQTCVLTEAPDTWARTYYRNTSGGELLAALSLMGPGGRTVQTHCAVEAQDDPATCETPREPSAGGSAQYTAVAEFATPVDGTDVGPLLLRSGSNSTEPGGR
ncbi:hypothetical protein HY68_10220 [Streptomyces sp. AcH 505]|uniref:hypothetical protein n=1 Tax=Streptomyces sp. AcH 505 TaxID=352211 RepID=UPI00059227F5|nr:hypothetical protein HY68_10220 [Streptomyces sp. AcH 505]